MTVEEWLGKENQLGTDIWTKKYRNEGEDFEAWVQRISGGMKKSGNTSKTKSFYSGEEFYQIGDCIGRAER